MRDVRSMQHIPASRRGAGMQNSAVEFHLPRLFRGNGMQNSAAESYLPRLFRGTGMQNSAVEFHLPRLFRGNGMPDNTPGFSHPRVRAGSMCVIAALFLFAGLLQAQDTLRLTPAPQVSAVSQTRRTIATAAVGGILAGSMVGAYFDWWKDARDPFRFKDDGLFNNYSLGVDKIGHAYTSYFYFNTFRNILMWGGYDEKSSLWWSAGAAVFFAVSIEIGDGFTDFGFSGWDLAFNMAGLGYGMLQTAVPFLQNFKLKWSYVPQDGYRWPPKFTDHYDAHTYWLACNVHQLLPEPLRGYWPEFIQLAIGYGVDDRQTRRKALIGFDLNLTVFRAEQPELRLLEQTVDLFHVPMPGVKFTEGKKPKYSLIQWN